jgi:8-oxo-dGTP pyrophosphatase MutT (NUDIX family)
LKRQILHGRREKETLKEALIREIQEELTVQLDQTACSTWVFEPKHTVILKEQE